MTITHMANDPRLHPLGDAERDELEALLEALPPPLDPLDLSALDGFLVGVLLQPRAIARERWLGYIVDVDGRAPPPGLKLDRLQALVLCRHAELERAIAARQWFDPWIFEFEPDQGGSAPLPAQMVLPWVAGFCAALEAFPALLQIDDAALREPLAVLYANFDPEDLEDADDLRELIDQIEPPESTAEAVENLVRCSLLLADVSRPRAPATRPPRRK
ncbi:MAG TPA: UPF0149 family protein [Burkholderiaceae bacterium]